MFSAPLPVTVTQAAEVVPLPIGQVRIARIEPAIETPMREEAIAPPRRLVPRSLAKLTLLQLPAAATVIPKPRRTLTLTVAGDLGLGGHMQPVRGDGAMKLGAMVPWRELTERVRPLIDGDLNFANLETAVTERNDLRAEPKTFNFRTHPAGVRHLVGIGINLLSTANNHSMDFGATGAIDTVGHLDALLGQGGLKAHAGLGRNREEAGRPRLIPAADTHVAFSALGIVTSGFPYHRASDTRPGQMAYQSTEDFADTVRRLAEAPASYRILSVHHGIERMVQTDATAIRKLRHEAVLGHGVDLVVGHHAHVVQGIEMVNGRVIFYGLGNFLHPGMQNMASHGMCRDYGLFARLHLATDDRGHFQVRAIEVVPLRDMHYKTVPMSGSEAGDRVRNLNYLAGGLDAPDTGSVGVRFAVQANGTGLHCVAGAANDPGRAGQLCRAWKGPDELSGAHRARAAGSCGFVAPQIAQIARAREPVPAKAPTIRVAGEGRPERGPAVVPTSYFLGN